MSNHPTYNLTNHPNAITNHPNQYANHPAWFGNAPSTPTATCPPGQVRDLNGRCLPINEATPYGQNQFTPPPGPGGANPGNAFAPDPNAPYNPVLFSSFMRHKYWMDNAQNRGDDTATYGAGPMKTMAF